MKQNIKTWMAEARRYSAHIWGYDGLIDDHPELTAAACMEWQNPYEFVLWLGEKYDLTRADQDWGLNSDKPFTRSEVFA